MIEKTVNWILRKLPKRYGWTVLKVNEEGVTETVATFENRRNAKEYVDYKQRQFDWCDELIKKENNND